MRNFLLAAERVTSRLSFYALCLAGIGLVAMTTIVFAQVVARYGLHHSIFWAEPITVQIMAWFIFLGAAVGIREGSHLSFDVLLFIMPERAKPWFHALSDVAVGAFGFGMIWYGWQLAEKTANSIIPAVGISRAFDFVPIIGGGVLLLLFSLERILRRANGLQTLRFGDHAEE